MKNKTYIIIVIGILIIGGIVFFSQNNNSSKEGGEKIISKQGIHWHVKLNIKINGKDIEIPAGIGLGRIHLPIHTHNEDGIIHLEFSRTVREKDITLGRFFEIWNKKFSRQCIFDKCVGENSTIKMTVNGIENNDFENYVMQNNDEIEIIYESKGGGE